MSRHDDDFWARMLEKIDCAEGDLARAEQRLRTGGDDLVSPEWIERMVTSATAHPAPIRVVPVYGAHRRSRVRRVAAVTLGMLLAAAGTAYLVWPEGKDSDRTLDYAESIKLLGSLGQPERHYRSALMQVSGRVVYGINVLRRVRDEGPRDLSVAAADRLILLERLLNGGGSEFSQPDDSVQDVAAIVLDASRSVADRVRHVARLSELVGGGIAAVRRARL